MNRFIRLGNIILNLDHVIEICFVSKQRPTLWITTSEITGTENRVLRFLDEDALSAWDFLRHVAARAID